MIIVSKKIQNYSKYLVNHEPITIKVLKTLSENNKLPIRVYGMLGSSYSKLLKEHFKHGHYKSDHYNIRSVKAFIDGALGSRGAALLTPYYDDKNNCGLILISLDEFKSLAKLCIDSNFQLCTHAIGDKGNRMVLDVYSDITKNTNNHSRGIHIITCEGTPLILHIQDNQQKHFLSEVKEFYKAFVH